jgi:type VI secretion system protein ImpL
MKVPAPVLQRLRLLAPTRERWLRFAWLLLALWACGVVVAAWQLGTWRQELTRTLVQLNADAHFRARVPSREAVNPEWYRRKALALLSATERLQGASAWTVFIPGSWGAFDNLEEEVQARIEREFSDIVVETLRRELMARASRLSGVPLVPGTGELQPAGECQSPIPQTLQRRLSAAAEDLPEFVAVVQYVDGVAELDAAVQSFLSLQYSSGQPEQLRKLVAYTLGKELPGALEGAVRMFQVSEEVTIQPALLQARLQWATRCALEKGMGALHTRLLNTNDLFALEQGLRERSAGLFERPGRSVPFDRTLERYRAVHALLEDQHALLSQGRNGWMGQASLQLGPAYQRMLQRVAQTRLLGPEVLQQLQGQSGAAFAEFRRQFEQAFGRSGVPGIVWLDGENRFGLSKERAALRAGLTALLQASFMSEDPARGAAKSTVPVAMTRVLQEAGVLADERRKALANVVPAFPEQAQPAVRRVIDARVSELIYQRAFRSLKAALPVDAQAPLDVAAFRQQREQVLALQQVLKDAGGAWFGDRLAAVLDAELLRRLANLQQDWERLPLQDPRATSFAAWQGEPLPLAQALGADTGTVPPPSFARIASQLDQLVQQARGLLALGSPALASDPAAARWVGLQSELERYQARAADSSLLRLERYLGALGTDLRRENCSERLGTQVPVALHQDDIAQMHLQLHHALAQRCAELRAQLPAPAASLVR